MSPAEILAQYGPRESMEYGVVVVGASVVVPGSTSRRSIAPA